MAGSDTVRNAMTGTFMERILTGNIPVPFVRRWLGDAAEAGMPRVYEEVARRLADPEQARLLMMKYTAGNAKLVEPILDRFAATSARLAAPQAGRDGQ
jgi:hypothetical protein